jgi:hypothetical protein
MRFLEVSIFLQANRDIGAAAGWGDRRFLVPQYEEAAQRACLAGWVKTVSGI